MPKDIPHYLSSNVDTSKIDLGVKRPRFNFRNLLGDNLKEHHKNLESAFQELAGTEPVNKDNIPLLRVVENDIDALQLSRGGFLRSNDKDRTRHNTLEFEKTLKIYKHFLTTPNSLARARHGAIHDLDDPPQASTRPSSSHGIVTAFENHHMHSSLPQSPSFHQEALVDPYPSLGISSSTHKALGSSGGPGSFLDITPARLSTAPNPLRTTESTSPSRRDGLEGGLSWPSSGLTDGQPYTRGLPNSPIPARKSVFSQKQTRSCDNSQDAKTSSPSRVNASYRVTSLGTGNDMVPRGRPQTRNHNDRPHEPEVRKPEIPKPPQIIWTEKPLPRLPSESQGGSSRIRSGDETFETGERPGVPKAMSRHRSAVGGNAGAATEGFSNQVAPTSDTLALQQTPPGHAVVGSEPAQRSTSHDQHGSRQASHSTSLGLSYLAYAQGVSVGQWNHQHTETAHHNIGVINVHPGAFVAIQGGEVAAQNLQYSLSAVPQLIPSNPPALAQHEVQQPFSPMLTSQGAHVRRPPSRNQSLPSLLDVEPNTSLHDESTDDGKHSALDVEPNTSWEDDGAEDSEEKSFAKLREWISRLDPPRAIYWMSKATGAQEAAMQRLVREFHTECVPSCWLFVQRGCDSTALSRFIGELAEDMARCVPTFRSKSLHDCAKDFDPVWQAEAQRLLIEPWWKVAESERKTPLLVVSNLHECDENAVDRALDFLRLCLPQLPAYVLVLASVKRQKLFDLGEKLTQLAEDCRLELDDSAQPR
ncbi:hypothetical protein DFP72DRAFT_1149399 [Ephemerocybe angulata]|uniref:Uncharacterized protein n=1 Tax=Ephemerocybe angulata TaxID=980116 RepID=A0A8H6HKA9_9AGAR|nr:hypothetical protein DFP72DRAFT_1149399 [Tulosesus angulatus]